MKDLSHQGFEVCELCGQAIPEPTTVLGQMVRNKRAARRLSYRQAAKEAGMSFSTMARIEGGAEPDFKNFRQLVGWLGLDADQVFALISERLGETL